jgi:hypothetical protein
MPTGASREAAGEVSGPFGTPDGSRAHIDTMLQDFVDLDGRTGFGGLSTRADDARARVIVGRTGAGKTVYMRRLYSFQESSPSTYTDSPQQTLPQTELIVRVGQWYSDTFLTEKWMLLWNRAILRSLATHVLASREFRPLPDGAADELSHYAHLLGTFRQPRSIYSELRDMINSHNTGQHLTRYLEHSDWDDLEHVLAEVLRSSRPVFFYLDAVDDFFDRAPLYWLKCQKGLFLQVMQLLRDSKFGSRLHVVICVRDLVYSSVLASEHGPRYYGEPHIRVLNWTREAIEVLLHEKLRRLDSAYLMAPGLTNPVEAWLGTTWLHNERRGVTEDVLNYILRHTRLIPRDVVAVGNDLCMEIARHKQAGGGELPQEAIRSVVGMAGKRAGDAQLAQCASQISADMMPRDAAKKGYADFFVSNQEYAATVRDRLKGVLATVGKDRFPPEELKLLDDMGRVEFDGLTKVSAVLWQAGLLGYVDSGRCRFYSLAGVGDMDVPCDAEEYVLHPCVLDAVHAMRSVGPVPVDPYARA